MSENIKTTQKVSDLLKLVAIAAICTAPLIYTAGWFYTYFLFDNFNIGLLNLNIQREYFFLYGFLSIKYKSGLFLIFFLSALLIITILILIYKKYRTFQYKTVLYILMPVLIFFTFIAFYYLGKQSAQITYEMQAKHDFPSYPGVKIWMKPDINPNLKKIAFEWEKGCYRLLTINNGYVFLFYPGQYNDKIPVEVIPVSKVDAIRILPQYQSCK